MNHETKLQIRWMDKVIREAVSCHIGFFKEYREVPFARPTVADVIV